MKIYTSQNGKNKKAYCRMVKWRVRVELMDKSYYLLVITFIYMDNFVNTIKYLSIFPSTNSKIIFNSRMLKYQTNQLSRWQVDIGSLII